MDRHLLQGPSQLALKIAMAQLTVEILRLAPKEKVQIHRFIFHPASSPIPHLISTPAFDSIARDGLAHITGQGTA